MSLHTRRRTGAPGPMNANRRRAEISSAPNWHRPSTRHAFLLAVGLAVGIGAALMVQRCLEQHAGPRIAPLEGGTEGFAGQPARDSAGTSQGTAYCMGCRAIVGLVEPERVTLRNGRDAVRGRCALCGRTVSRLLPSRRMPAST